MQTASGLQAVCRWLEGLLEGAEYQRPGPDGRLDRYRLARPAVHLGWVPPGMAVDRIGGVRIPCLVVGADSVDADEDATEYRMRVTAAVYDPGHQQGQEQPLTLLANFEGYLTLLNLLDLVRAALLRERTVAGRFALSGAVRLQTYEEQPWPYWYGALQFTLIDTAYPQTRFAEILT